MVYSFLTGVFIGMLSTSIYRYVVLKEVAHILTQKNLIKVAIGFVICFVLYLSLYYLSEWGYGAIWERTQDEIKFHKEHSSWLSSMLGTLMLLLTWTAIYFAIKFLFRSNQNRLEELELNSILKEAQLNTLKGQVNPHFMFNSLNNIRGLMLEDVHKSRDMITKLSEMLQYALVKNTVDAIPLEEELEMVDNYIALSKIQMEDRLKFEKNVDFETLGISIPPMIIQLLVENAAKHGISNLKEGGTIALTTWKKRNNLHITVVNTGKLQISKDSTQLGLKNIRQRLRLLYGNKASFSLREAHNEVVANVQIPLS